jgi:hypothetical protein
MKNLSTKIYNVLIDLHETNNFNAKEMQSKHRIGTRIFILLRERDMIRKESNGMYKYVAEMPTKVIANALTKEVQKQARIAAIDSKQQKNQMTIKPLKRVERIAPVKYPVQEVQQAEEQHTPYPVMDIVIAFLAGMIAAGFVSLIWK